MPSKSRRPPLPAQPLPEEVPEAIAAMLAIEADPAVALPAGYTYEWKWDGIRALCRIADGQLAIFGRQQNDISFRYPELAGLVDVFAGHRVWLDGELIAIDRDSTGVGRPSFAALQHRMHVASAEQALVRARQTPASLMVFDLLHLDGHNLRPLPLKARRELLDTFEAALDTPFSQLTPTYAEDRAAVLHSAHALGLEGAMAKRLDSPYQPGARSADWLKLKLRRRDKFVIGGWVPQSGAAGLVSSLLVGYYPAAANTPKLLYAGKVGSGFSHHDHTLLVGELNRLARPASPFAVVRGLPKAQFVEPRLAAEVEFLEWTPTGHLRQPSYQGLRMDKEPQDVVLRTGLITG